MAHVLLVVIVVLTGSFTGVLQAPEDGTDVVTAAKRVITEPGLNTLGLKDRRDITRLVAQSALQVCAVISIKAHVSSLYCCCCSHVLVGESTRFPSTFSVLTWHIYLAA